MKTTTSTPSRQNYSPNAFNLLLGIAHDEMKRVQHLLQCELAKAQKKLSEN